MQILCQCTDKTKTIIIDEELKNPVIFNVDIKMNEEGKVHGPVSNTDGHDVVTDNPVHDPVSYTPLVKRTATPMLESGRDQMHINDIHQPAKRPRLRGKALNSKEGGRT